MGFLRKNRIVDDEDFIDASDDDVIMDEPETNDNGNKNGFGNIGTAPDGLELKVVRPEKYQDVAIIADNLLAGKTVVIDFAETNKELVKRIKDFLGGVTYSIAGQLQKVTNTTYIATPNNVGVSNVERSSGGYED